MTNELPRVVNRAACETGQNEEHDEIGSVESKKDVKDRAQSTVIPLGEDAPKKKQDRHTDGGRHNWVEERHDDKSLIPQRVLRQSDLYERLAYAAIQIDVYGYDSPSPVEYLVVANG